MTETKIGKCNSVDISEQKLAKSLNVFEENLQYHVSVISSKKFDLHVNYS